MADPSITFLMRSGQLGGMELRVLSEAGWLQKEGWRVRIAATPFSGFVHFQAMAAAEQLTASELSFPLFMEDWRWRHIQRMRAGLRAMQLQNKLAADVVHVPFAWTDQGLSTLWLAGCVAERVVISVHNVFPEWHMTAWHRRQMSRAFSRVVGIYGVSSAATEAYAEIFSDLIPQAAEIRTIPNFVDCERFAPSASGRRAIRQALGFADGALVIAVLGRISEQKQPTLVVEAFARLSAHCPSHDLRLLFIGGGELEDALWREARRAGVADRIRVTGFVEDPQRYLLAADLHLLASIREGFGIATIEAMACGIPVIATNTKASREILSPRAGGILVEQGDANSIVEGMRQLLLDDQQRIKRGRRARAEALANYGKDKWIARMRSFYDPAITGAARQSEGMRP